MEVPDVEIKRENTAYGIDTKNETVVYETVGEKLTSGEFLVQLERQLTPAAPPARTTYERLNIDPSLKTDLQVLEDMRDEFERIKNEYNELTQGKTNLLKMAASGEKELANQQLAADELSRLLDERDMGALIKDLQTKFEKNTMKLPDQQQILDASKAQLLRRLRELKKVDLDGAPPSGSSASVVVDNDDETTTPPSIQVAALVSRLNELERIAGIDTSSRLKYSFSDIPSALCQLTHQLLLLDPKRVEAIQELTNTLAKEYERLAGVLSGYGENEKKIEVLYSNMNRWLSLGHSLPRVIDKLQICAGLATEVSSLDSRMSNIESSCAALEALLESSNKKLDTIAKALPKYVASPN